MAFPRFWRLNGGEFKGYIAAADTKSEIWRRIERASDLDPYCGVALSVRPEYAAAIVAGVKRVQFRRKRIHVPASHAIFYAAAPEKRLVCVCEAFCAGLTGGFGRSPGALGRVGRH